MGVFFICPMGFSMLIYLGISSSFTNFDIANPLDTSSLPSHLHLNSTTGVISGFIDSSVYIPSPRLYTIRGSYVCTNNSNNNNNSNNDFAVFVNITIQIDCNDGYIHNHNNTKCVIYKQCPMNCSNTLNPLSPLSNNINNDNIHGVCDHTSGICLCSDPWTGNHCELLKCPNGNPYIQQHKQYIQTNLSLYLYFKLI